MDTRQVPFDSDALRANIASTAQTVVIPDRYQPLVAAVAEFYGVRTSLTETVSEYFHTFRNVDLLIEGFQTILLRNWSYFERSAERETLFDLLAELVLELLHAPLTDAQFSLLLRGLSTWGTAALNGSHGAAYDQSLATIGEALSRLLPEHPSAFLERDALLSDLVSRAVRRPALAPTYTRALPGAAHDRLPPHSRAPRRARLGSGPGRRTHRSGRHRQAFHLSCQAAPGRPAGQRRVRLLRGAAAARPPRVLRHPRARDRPALPGREPRGPVCGLPLLFRDDTLGYRQDEVMVDLLGVVKQMLLPDRHMDVERILSRLTAFFRDRDNQFLLMRFKCYEAIGVAIGEACNIEAADHLLEDILSWRFQYPDISGSTDEWETVVNPYHLPKIRCWMHIIESNPALYERLAAALNVQLRLGGVYIADTDLFQRDVTRFLNADIRPIYFVAKQLLRTLPVYFSEVGAEGEFRAVSTEIDEMCWRRDTLMHFLRKQSHAESSNRLVAFSRAVLHYWMTLDPSRLEPFLSANTLAAVRVEREWAQGPHETLLALQRHCARRGGSRNGRVSAGGGPRRSLHRALAHADSGRARSSARQAHRGPGVAPGRTRRAATPAASTTGAGWR